MKLHTAIILLATTLFSFAPTVHAGPLDQKLVDLDNKTEEAAANAGNDYDDSNAQSGADQTCDMGTLRILYNEVKYSHLFMNNQLLLQSKVSQIQQGCQDAQSKAQVSNERLKELADEYQKALDAENAYQANYQKKSSSTQPNQ